MQIRRLEKEDLKYANNLRNKNIDFIRQPFPHNLKQQEEWFNTNPLYWIILKEYKNIVGKNKEGNIYEDDFIKVGIIGLTGIDLLHRKAELSLITEDYLIKEYADFALDFVERYAFGKLNLNKIFITAYSYDDKKNEYFSKRYKKEYTLKENVFYSGKFFDEYCYVLYAKEYFK